VEVLSSRVIIRPFDFARSEHFYGSALGLPIYREFGSGSERGVVYFLGGGFLELSGGSPTPAGSNLGETHQQLTAAGVDIVDPPQRRPWGLEEMWIADPDGVRIAVIEVPPDHPLRRR
jgi:catechol 2,3-dioxygenase-like lactoylglutathione lyase family enzyme